MFVNYLESGYCVISTEIWKAQAMTALTGAHNTKYVVPFHVQYRSVPSGSCIWQFLQENNLLCKNTWKVPLGALALRVKIIWAMLTTKEKMQKLCDRKNPQKQRDIYTLPTIFCLHHLDSWDWRRRHFNWFDTSHVSSSVLDFTHSTIW